ncbi:MAG TPA: hypothetical protein VGD58_33420 [Herpetosiphonaceae bacterium]
MSHSVLTFITKVKPDKVAELNQLLAEIADNLLEQSHLPFPRLKLLHFASLFLSDDPNYGATLVFENNFDGPLDPYLDELYRHAADGLQRIYSCCVDYPARSAADREQMLSYLRAHVVRPNAYHIGNPGRSAARIAQEAQLRDLLENTADTLTCGDRPRLPAHELRQRLQDAVSSQPDFSWAASFQPRLSRAEQIIPMLKFRGTIVLAGLIVLLFWQVMIPLILLYLAVLWWKERHDLVWRGVAKHDHVGKLTQREDRTHTFQNHMASFALVKPGRFRRLTLWAVLWFVNLKARTAIHGELSGIPSIHFAHWSIIDGGRRLLFVSNFDGSWENYLDDFIDKASPGLTAIWSNTVNFPRTRFLIFGGARDGSRFKADARAYQVYTNVWYSAYRDLTVQSIDANSAIREGLSQPLEPADVQTWLHRF